MSTSPKGRFIGSRINVHILSWDTNPHLNFEYHWQIDNIYPVPNISGQESNLNKVYYDGNDKSNVTGGRVRSYTVKEGKNIYST